MNNNIKELVSMSKLTGIHSDLVQGGGGNTSVKIDDTRMIIKASGFELRNVEMDHGFVMVNYKNIKYFFSKTKHENVNEESSSIVENNILKMDIRNELRPSIEAGFHSLLKKYVIHTHSVYANILSCAIDGDKIFEEIMKKHKLSFTWVKYATPGNKLTCEIVNALNIDVVKGDFPEVIILQNHGIILNSDDYDKVIELNSLVNNAIKEHFNICNNYPDIVLEKVDEECYISHTEYVRKFLNNDMIFERVIFPDQIVYFDNNISFTHNKKKINVDLENKRITYHCKEREAKAIEETITAYLYIIYNIESNNMKVNSIALSDVEIIKNMESEKYRRDLLNTANK